jgi:hypothetical protein
VKMPCKPVRLQQLATTALTRELPKNKFYRI